MYQKIYYKDKVCDTVLYQGTNLVSKYSSIQSIFANGEQGFWYDTNDLTTLYQDAAGTIPVTAVGQPVGLILDKSNGLVLGDELVTNGSFNNGLVGWVGNSSVTLNRDTTIFSNGGAKITVNDSFYTTFSTNLGSNFVVGKRYLVSADVYTPGTNTVDIVAAIGFVPSGLMNNTVMQKNTNVVERLSTVFVATSTAHRLFCSITKKDGLAWGAIGDVAHFDNISVREVKGNHASQSISASRPILRKNAVTGANYLEFDGADDFLQTNSINFTATDKMSLFAGVTELSDDTQIIAELSPSTTFNARTFYLVAGAASGGNGYVSMARGSNAASTAIAARNFTYLAPDFAVLSIKHDISGDLSRMRRNGVIGIDGLADKGTGNFGNYPLFIGRRAGTSLPFNGHLYSLIGIGRLTTDSETIAVEKAIAKNVGVTLNV